MPKRSNASPAEARRGSVNRDQPLAVGNASRAVQPQVGNASQEVQRQEVANPEVPQPKFKVHFIGSQRPFRPDLSEKLSARRKLSHTEVIPLSVLLT
jgi:hypothetical protein